MPIIDNDVMTPLVRASYNGHGETVQVLLEAGADVNTGDADGTTALIGAAMRGRTGIVQTLLEEGADVNSVTNDGKSP
jgi:ankyrin repeat protein